MRIQWMPTTFLLTAILALAGAQSAFGQAGAAAAAKSDRPGIMDGQFDLGVGGFWTFANSTSGLGTEQKQSNSYGAIAQLRYIVSPLVGAEFAFSYNNANQAFTPAAGNCALACNNPPTAISAKGLLPSFSYVVSKKIGSIQPFVSAGLGLLVVVPGTTPFGNNTAMRGAYIAGGGVDWNVTSHMGVRLQVRDSFYKAPNVSVIYPATGTFTSEVEPAGGIIYRF